jgi:hypothetical protein
MPQLFSKKNGWAHFLMLAGTAAVCGLEFLNEFPQYFQVKTVMDGGEACCLAG